LLAQPGLRKSYEICLRRKRRYIQAQEAQVMKHKPLDRTLFATALLAALTGGWTQAQAQAQAPSLPIAFTVSCAASGSVPPAVKDFKVEDAWVRATVPGQKGTGAFMRLTSGVDARLVGVQSPIAGVAQIHRMVMKDGVMKMLPVEGGVPLPKGQTVALAPGGLHLMLMDLNRPVTAGTSVPVMLTVEGGLFGNGFHCPKPGAIITIQAPVRALGANAGGMMHGDHMDHM
jgi:copper(I)-binding protein